MERLQPLSKLVVRNDKTINQEAFYNFTQTFFECLESLNSPPPYQCNRSNKSVVLKHASFLFQIITRDPQMAISISPNLLQICNLLMNPLNDNQIREETWRQLINCINCYDILVVFKNFLSTSFEVGTSKNRIDIGEVGKMNEDSILKQFDQILIKLKKSPDFEKFKINLQITSEAFSVKALKSFSTQTRTKIIIQIILEIGLLEKKFKATLFNVDVDPRLIVYISEIFSSVPPNQTNSQIIYRLIKWSFPYVIQNESNEDLTKRANMLYFINHSKYRGSLSLSYFRVVQNESLDSSFRHFYKVIKPNFHDVFVKIIDRSIQILPIMINNIKDTTDNYFYMYNMCKFFTHVLRLKGITRSLLQFENEKSIIGYYLSISIYNLPFEMLPFMTIYLLTFLIDRKKINFNEENHFVDNLLSIVSPDFITQIIQVVSKFASQMTVGFSPSLFKIKDENLRKQILNNPVIFERENVKNQTLHELIKKSNFVINTVSTTTESSIVTTTTSVVSNDANTNDSNNSGSSKLIQSVSSDGFFKMLRSVHFFFNIDCWSFSSDESFEFIFDYIQCFDRLVDDALLSIITDTFSCLIKLFSNFDLNDFDFSLVIEKFLPFIFKNLMEKKHNSSRKELLFCAFERFICVLNMNFLFSLQMSKIWCVSIMSMLPKNNLVVLHAAIQSCLDGLPYSLSLVHAIFISISDWKFRDSQIIGFLSCISIISPEFRNYSLQELELCASSTTKVDSNMICMSFLLLLHNLFNKQTNETKIDKEVRVLFLDSLGKMRSSPSLVTSLLLILPSFYDQLENRFELLFDTILMDVNELMIKLMESKLTSFNSIESKVSQHQQQTSLSTPGSLSSSLYRNNSSYVISSSPISPFISPSFSNTESRTESDPVLNANLKIQNDDLSTFSKGQNDSIRKIVDEKDFTTIQIFKSISFFCVELFLSAKKRILIRKKIIELLHSWTNFNNKRINGTFYEEFKVILYRSIGFCFSPPKSKLFNMKKVTSFNQNDTFFVSKNSPSSFVINDNDELSYNMKISLDYSSSIHSLKPLRNSPFVKIKSPQTVLETINEKAKQSAEMRPQSQLRSKLNHFSFRGRNKNQESQTVSKSQFVCMPGLSLFFDALEEANGSEIEQGNETALNTEFVQQFAINFKKQFFVRLIFIGCKKKNQTNNNSNNNNNGDDEGSSISDKNDSEANITKSKGTASVAADDKSEKISEKSEIETNKNKGDDAVGDGENVACDRFDFDVGDSVYGSFNSEDFSPLFVRFLNSLGQRDKSDRIISSSALHDVIFEFRHNDQHIVAVVWVDNPVITESVVRQFSKRSRHLVYIVLSPSKSGIIHTKVLYSSLLLETCNSRSSIKIGNQNGYSSSNNNSTVGTPNLCPPPNSVSGPGGEKDRDVFYFDAYRFYNYPNCDRINPSCFPFEGFGPLIGSLFLPYTLIAKLVTETAVNAVLFRKTQLKNLNQCRVNKKKKRKLFQYRQ